MYPSRCSSLDISVCRVCTDERGVGCRLTQAKEAGASIEIDGKKVALGIPGGRSSVTNTAQSSGGSQAPPGIPLGRGATPDEAAAAMLLYVFQIGSSILAKSNTHLCIAWLHRLRRSFLDTLWKSLEELGFKFNTKFLYTNFWISITLDCQLSGGLLESLIYRVLRI